MQIFYMTQPNSVYLILYGSSMHRAKPKHDHIKSCRHTPLCNISLHCCPGTLDLLYFTGHLLFYRAGPRCRNGELNYSQSEL